MLSCLICEAELCDERTAEEALKSPSRAVAWFGTVSVCHPAGTLLVKCPRCSSWLEPVAPTITQDGVTPWSLRLPGEIS